MADILIRGIEMPKENEILVFDMWHGKMYARSTANTGSNSYEVIVLPEGHGRLGDLNALKENLRTVEFWNGSEQIVSEQDIDDAPTIVQAEGDGEDVD